MSNLSKPEAPIVELSHQSWDFNTSADQSLVDQLEAGKVLYFPQLTFELTEQEQALLDPSLVDPKRKNISFNADKDLLRGVKDSANEATVKNLLIRYHQACQRLIDALLPHYKNYLLQPVNSLRVHDISTWQNKNSWRKDDTRLHVDAFPSRPIHGQRILRIFNNINPSGKPRSWRVGEDFEALAKRILPTIKPYSPFSSWLQDKLKITKSQRTHYDYLMLCMHDAMKADLNYQKNGIQWDVEFFPGTTWVCFSDQVAHAAMGGQYMLEQTYLLDLKGLKNPELSPLNILENLTGKSLL